MKINRRKKIFMGAGVGFILFLIIILGIKMNNEKENSWVKKPENTEERFKAQQQEPSNITVLERKTGEKLSKTQETSEQKENLTEREEVGYKTFKKLAREIDMRDKKTGAKIQGKLYIALDIKVAVNKETGKVLRVLDKTPPYVISDTPGLYWKTQGFTVDPIDPMHVRYETTGQAAYRKGSEWTVQPAMNKTTPPSMLGEVETLAVVLDFES